MSNASNYLESGLLTHIFRTSSFSKPSTIAVGLTQNVPVDSDIGSTPNELANTGAYARVNVGAPSDSLWGPPVQDSFGSGYLGNTSAITFPTASANWGNTSGVIVTDSSTYGAGNILFWGAIPTPRNILANDTFSFGVSGLKIFVN